MAITIDSIRSSFRGSITKPEDELYKPLAHRWSINEEGKPSVIFQPVCEEDVGAAIKYATSNRLEVAVAGGGYSFMGASSSDGAIIDMGRMRNTWVDNAAVGTEGILTCEGGARVSDVALACEKRGVFVPLPSHKEIGYAGFTLGGGLGWGSGVFGLAIDILTEVRIVLASGEAVTASETENPDLFWACRGAGYNFGVVVKLRYRAIPLMHKVWFGALCYPKPMYSAVLKACDKYAETQTDDDMIAIAITTLIPEAKGQEVMIMMPYYHGDSEEEFKKRFKVFLDIPHVANLCRSCWFHESADFFPEAMWPRTHRYSDGTLFTSLAPEIWEPTFDKVREWYEVDEGRRAGTQIFLGLYNWRRALNDDAHKHSAWPPNRNKPKDPRGVLWKDMAVYIGFDQEHEAEDAKTWSKDIVAMVRNKHAELIGSDIIGGVVYPNAGALKEFTGEYMYKENYPRLQQLKKRYDPANVFHKKHPIQPAP